MRTCGVLCGVVAICGVVACGGGIVSPAKPAVGAVTLKFRTAELKDLLFDGKRLIVRLVATNPHATLRRSWKRVEVLYGSATLTDEFGNVFKCQGATPDLFLDPGQTVEVDIHFDYPTPKSSKFVLSIQGDAFKQGGEWKFAFGRPPPPKVSK